MAIKTHHLFWLVAALMFGAWPLVLPAAHGNAPAAISQSAESAPHTAA